MLHSYATGEAASQGMADRMAAEINPDLEQPVQVEFGDESVAYRRTVPRVHLYVYLIRFGRLVLEIQEVDQGFDEERVAAVMAAAESDWSPSISAFHAPVPEIGAGYLGTPHRIRFWRVVPSCRRCRRR